MANDVKSLRMKLGMNQREFAEALAGVKLRDIGGRIGDVRALSAVIIANYEAGRRAPDRLMRKAMQILAGLCYGKVKSLSISENNPRQWRIERRQEHENSEGMVSSRVELVR